MTLSLGVLAKDSAHYVGTLLRAGREFADEVVVGVDSSSTDGTEDVCRKYADKLFRLEPIGTSERALAWLNEQCTGDWILRLDHDELPSAGLIRSLPNIMADREATHCWLPTRWVVGDRRDRWIGQDPWWPGWQLRMFRNIRSLVSFPGFLHSDYAVQGAARYVTEGSIYHYNLVVHDERARKAKAAHYDGLSPGNSLEHYYLPDLGAVSTRSIPDDDLPWTGNGTFGRRRIRRIIRDWTPAGPAAARRRSPPDVSLADMRRAERRQSDYADDLFQAALVCTWCPTSMAAGETCAVELQLRNDSPQEWWPEATEAPQVRIAYHWLLTSGEPSLFEGSRTRLPRPLRPGESTKMIATVQAPAEPGKYLLQWDPVIDGVSWFTWKGWHGPVVAVDVGPPRLRSASESESTVGYLDRSSRIPGWFRGAEAEALARLSYTLPDDAVIVEIGSFLGSGTVLLAGPRKSRGSGKVHCVDSFDGFGDAFSVPVYRTILDSLGGGSLREHFDEYMRQAGLTEWVEVHQDRAETVAATWNTPIDLLVMDGDHSRQGARETYQSWSPFLKPGGIIAVHNSEPREYAADHDGQRQLVLREILPPRYTDIRLVGSTTFARLDTGAERAPK